LEKCKNTSYGKQIGQIERSLMNGPPATLTTAKPNNATIVPAKLDTSAVSTPLLVNEDAQSPQEGSEPSTSHSVTGEAVDETLHDLTQKPVSTTISVADDSSIATSSVGTLRGNEH
jgi:hypothetical protein